MRIVVTGGCGFVGKRICSLLVRQHLMIHRARVRDITVLDLEIPPDAEEWCKELVKDDPSIKVDENFPNITFIKGSICDIDVLVNAMVHADVVFHVAALVDFGNHPPAKILQVNVEGTRTLIQACIDSNIKILIQTGSCEAIRRWGDNVGIPSQTPHATRVEEFPGGYYAYSKALSEQLILDANGKRGANGTTTLLTCVLRGIGVYGEGDPYILPSVLKAAASGLLKYRIGNGKMDFMYVGNFAHAHVLALAELMDHKSESPIAGKALNASHEDPQTLYDISAPYLVKFGFSVPTRTIPRPLLLAVTWIMQFVCNRLPPNIRPKLSLTRESLEAVSTHGQFRDEHALKDIHFDLLFTEQEAFERTAAWIHDHVKLTVPKPNPWYGYMVATALGLVSSLTVYYFFRLQ